MKKLIALLGLMAFFSSCEKVIDVDLNSADPQTVFEANLQEGQDTLWFYLSQTADYFGNEEPPKLDGAQIEFTDADGVAFTAQSAGAGSYFVSGINSAADANFTVKVDYDGFTTIGESYLPEVVMLDTVRVYYGEAEGFLPEGYRIRFTFQEPGDRDNFYRLLVKINGEDEGGYILFEDQLIQGNYFTQDLAFYELEVGDIVEVELRSIDEKVYKYYQTLDAILGQNGPPGIAPANPITNLEGEIQLGYFGTYSTSAISDTVQ